MVLSLWSLRVDRPLASGKFLVLISARCWVDTTPYCGQKVMLSKKSNEAVENGSRDLLSCSTVPQPTVLPCPPRFWKHSLCLLVASLWFLALKWRSWFSHYATSRKVAVSRPDLIFSAALGPGVYSVSNRNEYQKQNNNVSGERDRCVGLTTLPPFVSLLSIQRGILNISQPYRPPRPVTGIVLLYGDGVCFLWGKNWTVNTATSIQYLAVNCEPIV
jgi:hypothetical protein